MVSKDASNENKESVVKYTRRVKTNEKLDKDRFRRDMGGTEEAYQEVMHRIFGE